MCTGSEFGLFERVQLFQEKGSFHLPVQFFEAHHGLRFVFGTGDRGGKVSLEIVWMVLEVGSFLDLFTADVCDIGSIRHLCTLHDQIVLISG